MPETSVETTETVLTLRQILENSYHHQMCITDLYWNVLLNFVRSIAQKIVAPGLFVNLHKN